MRNVRRTHEVQVSDTFGGHIQVFTTIVITKYCWKGFLQRLNAEIFQFHLDLLKLPPRLPQIFLIISRSTPHVIKHKFNQVLLNAANKLFIGFIYCRELFFKTKQCSIPSLLIKGKHFDNCRSCFALRNIAFVSTERGRWRYRRRGNGQRILGTGSRSCESPGKNT